MKKGITLAFIWIFFFVSIYSQSSEKGLNFYLDKAEKESPLLHDYQNQQQIAASELERLRSVYTRSKFEINGNYLFLPVVVNDNGSSSFKWNSQGESNYYGYDLGISSGQLQI